MYCHKSTHETTNHKDPRGADMNFFKRSQQGQSMVEYTVVLVALTTALMTAGLGSVGLSKNDDQSLLQAMHQRYTTQAYSLSITELPEGRDLAELAAYYDSLDKYPELSKRLQEASESINKVSQGISKVSDGVNTLKAYTDPKKALDNLDTTAMQNEITKTMKKAVKDSMNPF